MAFQGLYLMMKVMMNQLVAIITWGGKKTKQNNTESYKLVDKTLGFAVAKFCSSLIETLNNRP